VSLYFRANSSNSSSNLNNQNNSHTFFHSSLFYMVSRCPHSYDIQHIRESCERGQQVTADTFFRLPVNGKRSRILYRNLFCAICNNDSDVRYWSVEKDVCSDENPQSVNQNIQTAECGIVFSYSADMQLRTCKPVIRECAVGWTDERTAQLCQKYRGTDYKYLGVDKCYRNSFCANCNNVSDDRLVLV